MATPSDAPPISTDEKPQNPVSHVTQPVNDDRQDTKIEDVKESSPTSVFVNSEPIREEQVQNAVKFLSHPKVRGSPVIYRRSFLERKGLTKEEIDESFRRVPDPPPAVTTTQPVVTMQDGQIKSLPNGQQQPLAQVLKPTPVGPVGSSSQMGMISRFNWYHAIFSVGFLAASGAGTAVLLKNKIIPRLKSWIRKVVLEEDEEGLKKENSVKPNIAEEAVNAAKAAAAAAADVARACQDMLITKSEEKRFFEELINMLSVQAHEMKSMSNAMQKLEGQSINGRIALEEQVNQRISSASSQKPYANGKSYADPPSVRSLSPPASVEPSAAPHPKSYNEIMAMIQRGEKPSNIREINDAPPNPNQSVSNPRIAPRPKPWESNQPQNTSFNTSRTQESINTSNYVDLQPNGDDSVPWWQQKKVRITEIETSDEQGSGSQYVSSNNDQPPVQRTWVPPQPPPVVMPEAAAAIRQPKKSSVLNDDQLLAQSTDITNELQRITKISESGGSMDANIESSGVQSAEIAKEDNDSYLEA
ncbi:hypothetical protein OROHE_016132 [Orobanche hederae]